MSWVEYSVLKEKMKGSVDSLTRSAAAMASRRNGSPART
jgi:hypothetical protein